MSTQVEAGFHWSLINPWHQSVKCPLAGAMSFQTRLDSVIKETGLVEQVNDDITSTYASRAKGEKTAGDQWWKLSCEEDRDKGEGGEPSFFSLSDYLLNWSGRVTEVWQRVVFAVTQVTAEETSGYWFTSLLLIEYIVIVILLTCPLIQGQANAHAHIIPH